MDPNETLARARKAAQVILAQSMNPYEEELADLFTVLDEWITGGGFLPQSWEPRRRVRVVHVDNNGRRDADVLADMEHRAGFNVTAYYGQDKTDDN
jgi:hypothetical protein